MQAIGERDEQGPPSASTPRPRTLADVLEQGLDVPGRALVLLLGRQRGRHGAARLVAQHHHQGRLQVQHGVEQRGAGKGVHLCAWVVVGGG